MNYSVEFFIIISKNTKFDENNTKKEKIKWLNFFENEMIENKLRSKKKKKKIDNWVIGVILFFKLSFDKLKKNKTKKRNSNNSLLWWIKT